MVKRWSVRAKATGVAVTILAIALVASGISLVALVRATGERNIEATARLRAGDFAALLRSGTPPGELRIPLEENTLVQILDDGRVVAASPFAEGTPLVDAAGAGSLIEPVSLEEGDPFLFVVEPVRDAGVVVVVGRDLGPVEDVARVATGILVAVVPALLVAVGVTTWLTVGRALEPVERMRREVADISASDLDRRIAEPSGDDEIARLANTMNGMLDRLESSQEEQRRFVSDAAHELRNPIAAIRQHAETALAHPESKSARELAREVMSENVRLQRLAEDMLALARGDDVVERHVPVDLDDLVLEEARRLRATSDLTVDTTSIAAARTRGDPTRLERAVANLIDNASRHAATRVGLGTNTSDGLARLWVDDDGPGVPPEQRERVFERFARLDEARDRRSGGAGLGLAIVAEVVASYGGRVTVGESPWGGARFSIELPSAG